jgi:GT2 family glycosyltransferase
MSGATDLQHVTPATVYFAASDTDSPGYVDLRSNGPRRHGARQGCSAGDALLHWPRFLNVTVSTELLMEQSSPSKDALACTGVVAIGRNEGERLRRCLESLRPMSAHAVYVDSGSSDDSVGLARSAGFLVVELDCRTPFTAARARNEGLRTLLAAHPLLDYVFFVDGDCEVVPDWVETAVLFLEQHPDVAVAWGRRRERYPEKSVYNMLCDIEWSQVPPGETKACGGDAVMRIAAFQQVQGFRPDLICGEEPELCVRLRQAGWRIWRLNANMTLHDAAQYRFNQWWKRSLRSGYAYAQGVALHGAPPERHAVTEARRAWVWGLWIPLAIFVLAAAFGWWVLLLLLLYPLQVLRLNRRGTRSARDNWWRALTLVGSKFPEMLGQVKYLVDRLRRVQSRLIEYK